MILREAKKHSRGMKNGLATDRKLFHDKKNEKITENSIIYILICATNSQL